jgi:hypothetical protein
MHTCNSLPRGCARQLTLWWLSTTSNWMTSFLARISQRTGMMHTCATIYVCANVFMLSTSFGTTSRIAHARNRQVRLVRWVHKPSSMFDSLCALHTVTVTVMDPVMITFKGCLLWADPDSVLCPCARCCREENIPEYLGVWEKITVNPPIIPAQLD